MFFVVTSFLFNTSLMRFWVLFSFLLINISLILGENNLNLPLTISMENLIISSTETVDLLGISIDSKLSFSGYISFICRKAGNRVRNLNRFWSF